jgi:hypothetical protein
MTGRVILGVFLALGLSLALLGQSAQEIYQRALVQEQAAGNLKQAIELYLQAAKEAGKDRTLAAKALIRAAGSEEKLGQAVAAEVYAQVVRLYPEQREQASIAQARLSALRRTPATTPSSAQGGVSSRTDVSAVADSLFDEYCIRCHNQNAKSGGFVLDSLNTKNVSDSTVVWENILRRLRARRDPPVGLPRPDEGTYQSVVSKLELALDQAYPPNGPLNNADRATDAELAQRIAKFVWGGSPDAQLLDDAQHGKLHDPAVLDQQVRRMLRDPKSINLVTGFFERWLMLDNLANVKPDPARFPQFDQDLLQAMGTETRLFLDNQLRENHSALDLWTANYTFLNQRMARHYGIPNISTSEFRRVNWPNNDRAGILGQASLLTVTLSSPNRTSPTKRGIYLLNQFFGTDAPPPPPNVPALAGGQDERNLTMRERLAAHRSNPACASCHVIIDPIGFALENFDAIGQWRNTDGASPIDASGSFIDGTKFNGSAELRSGLLKYRDAYYHNVTQQLLGYALGRKARAWRLYDYEMPSVRAIVRAAAPNDYRWSSIIAGIVKSAPFQMKNIVP